MLDRLRSKIVIGFVGLLQQPYVWFLRSQRGRKNATRVARELADAAYKELRAGHWGWTLFLARSSIAADPQQALGYVILGFAHLRLDERAKANEAYEQAMRNFTSDTWTVAALGYLGLELEHYAGAEAACRRALTAKPDDVDLHLKLAIAVREQGRLDEAIALLQQARELWPQNAEVLTEIGVTRIKQDQLEEAIHVLTEATELDPASVIAHDQLGRALRYVERWEESLEQARAALALEPNDRGLQEIVKLCEKGVAGDLIRVYDEDDD